MTLKHDENAGFDFLNHDGSVRTKRAVSEYNVRITSVSGGGASKVRRGLEKNLQAVYFPIVPTKIGDVRLHVTAQGSSAGDAVEQPLKVDVRTHCLGIFQM